MQEKIYRIPKNLNEEFSLSAFYTMWDLGAILLLVGGATFAAVVLHIMGFFFFPVCFAVMSFRIKNYPAHYWAMAVFSYLLGKSTHYNEYTLFEKEQKANGNDELT
ncbi:MAG: hypothetical protein RR639_08390 [Hydrogenoanaerobacterium sp.]